MAPCEFSTWPTNPLRGSDSEGELTPANAMSERTARFLLVKLTGCQGYSVDDVGT